MIVAAGRSCGDNISQRTFLEFYFQRILHYTDRNQFNEILLCFITEIFGYFLFYFYFFLFVCFKHSRRVGKERIKEKKRLQQKSKEKRTKDKGQRTSRSRREEKRLFLFLNIKLLLFFFSFKTHVPVSLIRRLVVQDKQLFYIVFEEETN